jgi:hypothetical protein
MQTVRRDREINRLALGSLRLAGLIMRSITSVIGVSNILPTIHQRLSLCNDWIC